MNATKRSTARAGLILCSVLIVAATGCRTHVVHERTRTVYVPPPPPVIHVPAAPAPAPVVYVPPARAPQPPPVVVASPPAHAPVVVIQSENDFYEPLAAHGRWVVVGAYGRVWIPAHVEMGWRPYSNGYWQRTDAGWYWVSDEPWGWATYHYGRWDWHAAHGWLWVPHTQWAPAWVCWREGGGYVGWAPLRPTVTIGVHLHDVDYEPAFASRAFVFVEHRRMLEPVRPKTVIVNNTTIINKTVNITNVKVVNKTVINEGPRAEIIERASGRKVQAVAAHEFRSRDEAPVAARKRNTTQAVERETQPTASTEPRPEQNQATPSRNAQVSEKPAVTHEPSVAATPSVRPSVKPARSMSQSRDAVKPAPDDNKRETVTAKPTAPIVAPAARPGTKPARSVPSQPGLHPAEKPVVATKPTARLAASDPVRNEKRAEIVIAKPITPIPTVAPAAKPESEPGQAVSPQREPRSAEKPTVSTKPVQPTTTRTTEVMSRNEVRPATKSETKATRSAPASRPSSASFHTAPSVERPAAGRQISPREISRATEQNEAKENKAGAKGRPVKKVEGQEDRGNSSRPSR